MWNFFIKIETFIMSNCAQDKKQSHVLNPDIPIGVQDKNFMDFQISFNISRL